MCSPDLQGGNNSAESTIGPSRYEYVALQIDLAPPNTLNLLGPLITDYYSSALDNTDPQATSNAMNLLSRARERRQAVGGNTSKPRSDIAKDCFDGLIFLTPEVIAILRRSIGFIPNVSNPIRGEDVMTALPTLADELIGTSDAEMYNIVKYFEEQVKQNDGSSTTLLNLIVDKIGIILVNNLHPRALDIISSFKTMAALIRRNYLAPVLDVLPKEWIQSEINDGLLPEDTLIPKGPMSFKSSTY